MQKNEKILKIIRDTREQDPLDFGGYPVEIGVDTFSAGDYSLAGHDMPNDDFSIIIERKKNCSELINNLGAKWEQFEREMLALSKFKFARIVVCGPNNFEYLVTKGLTKLSLNFIYKRIAQIEIDYGVPMIFAGDRANTENYIYRLFRELDGRISNE